MIIFIGLNQITDIDIDKINKPYLPIASGKLTKINGIIIILISLFLSLLFITIPSSITNISYSLQLTIISSGILGTLYSLSPFRLKRFPLLAAFCILVVRGSFVNMGFFLEAKILLQQILMKINNNNNIQIIGDLLTSSTSSTAAATTITTTVSNKLGITIATTTTAATATTATGTVIPNLFYSSFKDIYQSFQYLINKYPESIILTSFFAIFGLVIAIMKDVPDIRGDLIYQIPSFSVKLGAKKMFRIAYRLLYSLLGCTSLIIFISYIKSINILSSIIKTTVSSSSLLKLLNTLQLVLQNTSSNMKLFISIIFFMMTIDVRNRAKKIEAENPDKVFTYYMHIWNIFYLCYLILPLMHF